VRGAVKAGVAYWALIFALGFVLGTVRMLWGAKALGETTFILIEIPVILTASWFAARWLLRRYAVQTLPAVALMGTLAFTLLMGAELALAMELSGQSPDAWFATLWHEPHLYGTLGQVAFAGMPVLVLQPSKQASSSLS
jgi:hypothetical protein